MKHLFLNHLSKHTRNIKTKHDFRERINIYRVKIHTGSINIQGEDHVFHVGSSEGNPRAKDNIQNLSREGRLPASRQYSTTALHPSWSGHQFLKGFQWCCGQVIGQNPTDPGMEMLVLSCLQS